MTTIIEAIRAIIPQLPFDIRAEVVAADMILRGFTQEDIVVVPQSLFKRRFEKDILEVAVKETKNGKEYCAIAVSREGIYDALPQALVHSSRRSKGQGMKSKDEMLDEIKLRKREEKFARQFFLPFENEFSHQRVVLEQEEQNILKAYQSQSRYTELLDQFWKLPEALSVEQKAKLIYILPILNKIVGNLYLMELCYRLILDLPVKLDVEFGNWFSTNNRFVLNEETTVLGVNTACGTTGTHGRPIMVMSLGPIPSVQVPQYVAGNKKHSEILSLNDFLLPLDVDYKINFIVEMEQEIRLSENSNVRLGYNFLMPGNNKAIVN
ncbi:MAG: type VI secretion system baseplate subunit TssG [Chitinophagaceae bacterium]|nr:type VI secretion system baseplate subunit TssG [Chitinophagaceae bacterium]